MSTVRKVKKSRDSVKEKDSTASSADHGLPSKKSSLQRTGSNVFSMFSFNQVQEFKEAFQMMDFNNDDLIDKEDLLRTFEAVGKFPNEEELHAMLAEANGPINFPTFLNIFGQKLIGVDNEETLKDAFSRWDDNKNGLINEERFKEALMTFEDKFNTDEVDTAFEDAPIRMKNGQSWLDYVEFTKKICGSDEKD